MAIPARTKALPGMAVNRTFSPSVRYANASANNGISSVRSQLRNLIVRGFGLGTSGYPGFRFLHLNMHKIRQLLMPETTLECPQRSFFSDLFNQPLPAASKLHLS